MKNFSKMLGISTICTLLLLGFATQASTTGDISTGTVIYTWSLLIYLDTQEKSIDTLFNTTYNKVYSTFTKTWLNIMKSVDYQSLVCLWAIKDGWLLSQFQKDKTALAISFKKDFIDLENQILSLEEKQDLQIDNNVNVFDAGTTYESEKAQIKDLIDTKVKLHKGFLTNFETNYLAKNTDFLSSYLQYSTANKDLVKGIQDKMAKVNSILAIFSELETTVTKINTKITGLDELIAKMEESKNKWLVNLDKTLQPMIDSNIKKYKKLQTLANELSLQKTFVVGQFQMDLDEYLTNNLQARYNRSQFVTLKNDIAKYKTKYYTTTSQLNCSNILSTTDESTALLSRINAMKAIANSWLVKIETEGISTTFKDQLFSGFQTVYVQKFKQRNNEYITYLKEHIKTSLRNFVSSLMPTTTVTIPTTTEETPAILTTVKFNRPFKTNEQSSEIKTLQKLLTTLWFYKGIIDWIYNKVTIEAVYQFQLSNWLVNQSNIKAWWWMGPATRAALNKVIQ